MSSVNWGDFPTWLATAAALIALWLAYWNGHDKSKASKRSDLTTILQIEISTQSLRLNVSHAQLQLNLENAKRAPNRLIVEAHEAELRTCVMLFLSNADRLAFCLLQNYLPESQWRAEYRNFFSRIIHEFPDHFGASCIYRNIRDLHDRWQRT